MKFIAEYGCSISTEHLAIEADSMESALQFAYESAFECRESFEGLHGVLDFAEFCEEEGYDEDRDSSWEEYKQMVEEEIEYCVEEFDEENEEHLDILADSGGEFFRV